MAGAYARSALMHDALGRRAGKKRVELRAQLLGRFVAAVGQQIVLVQPIARAGDMTGNRIDRLGEAFEAVCSARIDHHELVALQVAHHVFNADPVAAWLAGKLRLLWTWS